MANGQLRSVVHHLRKLVNPRGSDEVTDACLLERWLDGRDEAAFELVVWRHGPMVLGVCQRLLRHVQDAEDAFQATFLTLVRKAGSIAKRETLACWLYRVAYRVALRARTAAAKRRAQEIKSMDLLPAEPAQDLIWRDLRPVLDEEVNRLPAKLRGPFVLCYLEGKTNEQAARELGCPLGTVISRLARGRQRLRGRLARRGLAICGGLSLAGLCRAEAAAALPGPLVLRAIKAAVLMAAGKAVTGGISAPVIALTNGMVRTMLLRKIGVTAIVVLVLGLVGGAGALWAYCVSGAEPEERGQPAFSHAAVRGGRGKTRLVKIASPLEGILLFIGTEIKEGEKVPRSRICTVKYGGQTKKYRRLREGDRVKKGQVVAWLDDRLARSQLEIKKARLAAAKADHASALALKGVYDKEWERLTALRKRGKQLVAEAELQIAQVQRDRYAKEAISKEMAITVAEREVEEAQTLLELYAIRSSMDGVIHAISRYPGEAVTKHDTLMQLRISRKRHERGF
jgi:RNA polymerase sigma factor (sigma-70 family)